MTFRILRVLAAAALAALVTTSAAQAYPAPEITVTISDSSPGIGEPFVVSATDLGDATEATLTVTSQDESVPDSAIEIAGTQALTKPVVDESVSFTVTLSEAGVYDIVLTTDAGSSVSQVVTVGAEAAGGDVSLPSTGDSSSVIIGGVAAGLLALGLVIVLMVRRSRRAGA